MSDYIIIELEVSDSNIIKETLKELGYPFEEHKVAQNLMGYRGDKRSQVSNIIVRRRNVGAASNDVGFLKKANGKYDLILSEYDRGMPQGKTFMYKFKQTYIKKQSQKMLKKKGYKLKKQKVEEDGTIELRFS